MRIHTACRLLEFLKQNVNLNGCKSEPWLYLTQMMNVTNHYKMMEYITESGVKECTSSCTVILYL